MVLFGFWDNSLIKIRQSDHEFLNCCEVVLVGVVLKFHPLSIVAKIRACFLASLVFSTKRWSLLSWQEVRSKRLKNRFLKCDFIAVNLKGKGTNVIEEIPMGNDFIKNDFYFVNSVIFAP
jgi:hypothetical protein